MNRSRLHSVVLFILFLATTGCTTLSRLPEGPTPADFALTVCAQVIPKSGSKAVEGYTFVLEPDRTLRAATGAGCTLTTFPEPTTTLDTDEVQALYDLTQQIDFNHKQTPPSINVSRVWIRIVVSAEGHRWRADFATPIYGEEMSIPQDSPMYPASELTGELLVHSYLPGLKRIKLEPIPVDR